MGNRTSKLKRKQKADGRKKSVKQETIENGTTVEDNSISTGPAQPSDAGRIHF